MSSSPSLAVIQGAKEALDLGITGPEGIEISRPEEVRSHYGSFPIDPRLTHLLSLIPLPRFPFHPESSSSHLSAKIHWSMSFLGTISTS